MPVAVIIYETSSGYTEKMALAIKDAIEESGVQVLLRRTMKFEMDEMVNADAVILGSPTYHNNLINPMKAFLSKMELLNLKGKIGAAFGSYGSTGEAVGIITGSMKDSFGMDVAEPGLKLLSGWDESKLQQCLDFGKKIAEKINGRCDRL